MTTIDFYTRLGRMLEEGTIDRYAEVYAATMGVYGTLSPVTSIDPVNRDVSKADLVAPVALAFGRLT